MDISADLTCSRRLSTVLRRKGILFLFFRGGAGVAVKVVTAAGVGVAGAVRLVTFVARAATAIKGRFRTGVEETVFL